MPELPDGADEEDGEDSLAYNDQWLECQDSGAQWDWVLLIIRPRNDKIDLRLGQQPSPEELREQARTVE